MNTNQSFYRIVIAASLLVFLSMGIRQSFGVMGVEFTQHSGANQNWFGLAIALQNLMWGLCSPILGGLADRFGIRPVAIAGIVCYVFSLLLMAELGGWSFMAGQILFGIGLGAAGMSICIAAAIKACAPEKQSLVVAVITSLASFGQFLVVIIAEASLSQLGWVTTLMIASACMGLALVAALNLGQKSVTNPPNHSPQPLWQLLKNALADKNYRYLSLGFFVCGFQVVFIATHLSTFVQDQQISSTIASWALALVGLFNILGTLMFGWLGSHFSKKNLLCILYLSRSMVMLGFLIIPISAASTLVFGILMGLLWLGTVPLTSSLVACFFGTRYMSLLYGFVFFSHQIGSFMGAWMGGIVYSAFANYDLAWFISIVMGLVAVLLHYPIKERASLLIAKFS